MLIIREQITRCNVLLLQQLPQAPQIWKAQGLHTYYGSCYSRTLPARSEFPAARAREQVPFTSIFLSHYVQSFLQSKAYPSPLGQLQLQQHTSPNSEARFTCDFKGFAIYLGHRYTNRSPLKDTNAVSYPMYSRKLLIMNKNP